MRNLYTKTATVIPDAELGDSKSVALAPVTCEPKEPFTRPQPSIKVPALKCSGYLREEGLSKDPDGCNSTNDIVNIVATALREQFRAGSPGLKFKLIEVQGHIGDAVSPLCGGRWIPAQVNEAFSIDKDLIGKTVSVKNDSSDVAGRDRRDLGLFLIKRFNEAAALLRHSDGLYKNSDEVTAKRYGIGMNDFVMMGKTARSLGVRDGAPLALFYNPVICPAPDLQIRV
jgi:hypothetical protein